MRRLAVVAATAAVLVVGGSCAHEDNYQGPGRVIETSYDDPDTYWIPPTVIPGHTSCTSTGKTMSCYTTSPVVVPGYTIHDGPHWHVKIDGQDGKKHNLSVPEQLYDGCRTGMRWTYGEGCSIG